MGGGESKVTCNANENIFDKIAGLGREIVNNIDVELQEITTNLNLPNEKNKAFYDKGRKTIIHFQTVFSEYQRLIEEARTDYLTLQCSLDKDKQEIEKLNKDMNELSVTSSQDLNHQKAISEEWKQKCESREKKLNIETERRERAEAELLQLIIYKAKCEAYEKRLETIKGDLKETEKKLDEARKFKIHQQFK